jgi:hypothetical protein
MADTKFKPGNPGRPKGSANRFTKLRDEMLEAFDRLGGVDGLVEWARQDPDNQGAFYAMIARMLPRPIEVSSDGRLEVIIVPQGTPSPGEPACREATE